MCRALAAQGAVQRGGSGAWADLQGAFELGLQDEWELGRQRRGRVSLAAESARAKARGGEVQRPRRRPVPWRCDVADPGGQERAATRGWEEGQAEGFGVDPIAFGSPREEAICGVLPSPLLCVGEDGGQGQMQEH